VWKCDSANCTSVTASIDPTSTPPCTVTTVNATQQCTVSTGNLDLGVYKYSVSVTYNGKTVTEDPDVIVDNGAIGTLGTKNKKKN
jgi:hypothetical protein